MFHEALVDKLIAFPVFGDRNILLQKKKHYRFVKRLVINKTSFRLVKLIESKSFEFK